MKRDPGSEPPKAHVIFVNRFGWPDISATSQLLNELAADLVAYGYVVDVICARLLYEGDGRPLARVETHAGVTIRRLWSTRFGRARLIGRAIDYMTFYCSVMAYMLVRLRADCIVVAKTDPPLLSVGVAAAAAIRGARLVNWLQDLFPEIAERLGNLPVPRAVVSFLRWLRNWSLHRARVNVVLGERMRDELIGNGISASKVCVSPNWCDRTAIRVLSTSQSSLRSGLVGATFVVAYSGNLGRAHDYLTIVEAAEALKNEPILFLMIGGGAGMTELRAEVEIRHLSNVRFLGYQRRDRLADSMAAADVHLVTLRPELEGLIVPSKLYGAMAAGRPIVFIGDPRGEVARVITEFDCGFFVEPGDSAALASGLRRLAVGPDERNRLGANARHAFEGNFDRSAALRRWIGILGQLGT